MEQALSHPSYLWAHISDREAQVNKKGYNREYSVNVYHNIKSIGVFTSQLMKKNKKTNPVLFVKWNLRHICEYVVNKPLDQKHITLIDHNDSNQPQ